MIRYRCSVNTRRLKSKDKTVTTFVTDDEVTRHYSCTIVFVTTKLRSSFQIITFAFFYRQCFKGFRSYRHHMLSSLDKEERTTRNNLRLRRTERAEGVSFCRQTDLRTLPGLNLLRYQLMWRKNRSNPPRSEIK